MEYIQGCRIGWPSNELNVYRTIGRMSTRGHVLRILDRGAVASPRPLIYPPRQPHSPHSQANQRTYGGRHQQSPHMPSQDLAYRPPEGLSRDIECRSEVFRHAPSFSLQPLPKPDPGQSVRSRETGVGRWGRVTYC